MNTGDNNSAKVPYRSFWMGGFEGADHRNSAGLPLDMARASGHLQRLSEDYAAAARLGLGTVRESIGWRLAETAPQTWDLKRAEGMARCAKDHGLQVLWSLMHYGTPPDVSLFDDALIPRFAAFGAEVARKLGPLSDEGPVYSLINEIGFLAWAASETSLIWPYRRAASSSRLEGAEDDEQHPDDKHDTRRSGYAVKRRLVRAALAAMEAIRSIDPRARFLHIEPIVHICAPVGRDELQPLADTIADYQWQVWDLLCGKLEPQLGGCAAALDLIGVNHYHSSQWEAQTEARLNWLPPDARRRSPAALLAQTWQRYGRPLLVAETSHVGEGRAAWLDYIAGAVAEARAQGTPVAGVCLYPLVDRPDWDHASRWHRSGLFDVLPPRGEDSSRPEEDHCHPELEFERVAHPAYLSALTRWQCRLPHTVEPTMPALIVFSHLRWGFVFQRPQHLMVRLARNYRIIFIEEPVQAEGAPAWQRSDPAPGVEVWCPQTPVVAPGFHDDQLPALRALIEQLVADQALNDPLVWFTTPMALPLATSLQASGVVYDCMDELAAFRGAPRQLQQREAALLKVADLVLTGGPSLYEARRGRNPNVHCVPSAVDAVHFAPSRLLGDCAEAQTAAALHADIGHPRIGFFGVIDERIDLELLANAADARPDWQWVMAGPVVKIDPAVLPRRGNLHWLGMQPYAVLPYLAAQWSLCMMPFAINAATRFISPTKTLEYMAAEKPVVSTAVHDVVMLYGDVVRIASTPGAFVDACEKALSERPDAAARRQAAMLTTVWRNSWDSSAAAIAQLLEALPGRQAVLPVDPLGLIATPPPRSGGKQPAALLPVSAAGGAV